MARRLDRLARRAHAFHRFAHHPLCPAYASEVVPLGRRTRVCRGCALAATGAATGALIALAAPIPAALSLAIALAVAIPAAVAAVRPRTARARASKLLTRAAPLALATGLATFGARSHSASGAAIAAGVALSSLAAIAIYRRRGPDRSPCLACPERAAPRVCSGLRHIVQREAAFARLAGRLLAPPPSSDRRASATG